MRNTYENAHLVIIAYRHYCDQFIFCVFQIYMFEKIKHSKLFKYLNLLSKYLFFIHNRPDTVFGLIMQKHISLFKYL